ncbi:MULTISPECIES: hydantoinase B/oxoprolinase family protein [unclassified Aminobacter]|uniref:hydantoinase B/oxoprolinase family protein n=1 Tax=unclassified Aminobacter TaxID=2644704 RepID=UPI000464296F|nr:MULTISPECIES: hydantoinase B/oxoprolinase family protein [unclassified Aminobacter]TWG60593.1 N-methylhydantoinase B [Aminobacter sp. J44]TWH30320.1 N-methylhydantoinase B [Aminobacter sp. J15]
MRTADLDLVARAQEASSPLDAIEIELIRSGLQSVCEEMAEGLIRSSQSPNIKERRDCSCCLYSRDGEMAVQAEHIPIHLGVMAEAMLHILREFDVAQMQPGDVFLANDPYHGANHLPDFIVAGPLFVGGELVGFAASMAHHTDVGGMAPRSMPADATEIFQEGLRIPPVKLVDRGVLNAGIERIICANSRLPEERRADLGAQIASVTVAQNRIDEMAQKHSATDLHFAIAQIIGLSEKAFRKRLEALPERVWEGLAHADFGGEGIPIRVAVSKKDDRLVVDFTGTGGHTPSPFNSCFSNTLASVYMAVRISIAEGIAANAGLYRLIDVVAPEGTIVNPRYPCAISAATQVSYHTFDAMMTALADIVPELVLAGTGGGGVFSFGGFHPRTDRLFAYGEALGGGSGASAVADGESGMIPPVANLHDTPVEVLETSLPVRIERYELVEGSAGDGKFRGGFGLRRAFRMLAPVRCSFQISMPSNGPSGLYGGEPGRPTHATIEHADGRVQDVKRFTAASVDANSLVTIETAGGGGYGKAAERSPALTAEDELFGYGMRRAAAGRA